MENYQQQTTKTTTISEVSLSPIYPSNNNNNSSGGNNNNTTPTISSVPTITSTHHNNQHYVSVAAPSSTQGTYYIVADTGSQLQNENFRQTSGVSLLPPSHPGPSIGRWRDSICSWASNLWPSCGCLLVLCGAWHVAQIAQKTQFTKFETIIVPFIVIYVIIGFIALFFGFIVWLVPFFIVYFLALALRFHVIKRYQIQQNNCFVEFLLGILCCPCSISQMSRHVFGYKEALDGDARPFLQDYYDQPSQV